MGKFMGLIRVAAFLLGMPIVGAIASADYLATPTATTWSPLGGPVNAIERIGNTIYIGGGFTSLRSPDGTQTVLRNRLAAFDATTGELRQWNPGADNFVWALQQSSDGTGLFVGGFFTNIAGAARKGFAEVSTLTGTLVAGFNASVDGNVYAIEQSGTFVFLGGTFSTVNGQAQARVAAVDEATGAAKPGWNGSADGIVKALLAAEDGSGRLFVGGEFRTLSGQSRDFLGALNAGDGSANGWRPPVACTDLSNPCYVLDLAQDTQKVYAAVAGPGGQVVAYDLTSGTPHWAAHGDGNVQCVATDGDTVYAGGHFAPTFGTQIRTGFVALSAATGAVLDFAPRFFGGEQVREIVVEPNVLRIGGGYNRIDVNTTHQRYAEFPVKPAVHQLLNLSTRGVVQTGNHVLIGGFIIHGTPEGDLSPTSVVVRAIGPSLIPQNIPDALRDPTLELRDGSGNLIASNNNWKDSQEAAIRATGLAPKDDRESAIFAPLPDGTYTAIVRGLDESTGVALVEVYQTQ